MAERHSPTGSEQEVASETLRVESKLYYLDLKSNSRGRYLKIAEKGSNRERSTIIVPSAGIPWFVELFNYYAAGVSPLVPKELPIETKIFYFEVGSNPRGRFLRVSESGAGPRGRSSIIIPAGGQQGLAWATFRDALARVLAADLQLTIEEQGDRPQSSAAAAGAYFTLPHGTASVAGPQTVVGPGPAPPMLTTTENGGHIVRVGHKRFFFDLGSNQKGAYVRITEVVGVDRISLIVPAEALLLFREGLNLCIQQADQLFLNPRQHQYGQGAR